MPDDQNERALHRTASVLPVYFGGYGLGRCEVGCPQLTLNVLTPTIGDSIGRNAAAVSEIPSESIVVVVVVGAPADCDRFEAQTTRHWYGHTRVTLDKVRISKLRSCVVAPAPGSSPRLDRAGVEPAR